MSSLVLTALLDKSICFLDTQCFLEQSSLCNLMMLWYKIATGQHNGEYAGSHQRQTILCRDQGANAKAETACPSVAWFILRQCDLLQLPMVID